MSCHQRRLRSVWDLVTHSKPHFIQEAFETAPVVASIAHSPSRVLDDAPVHVGMVQTQKK